MKEEFEPKSFKNYNLTPEEQIKLDNQGKPGKRLHLTIAISPFFFIKKKDRKLWLCQDYHYLNDWTVKNVYPLPCISELMDNLKGAKYFSKMDIQWGYNNIQIRQGDKWKVAFKTNKGLFKPIVIFFRMCNSPAVRATAEFNLIKF